MMLLDNARPAWETGPLAGFPCTGVEVDLYEGSYHDVDSSELAFKIAGSMAFQDACKRARPVLMGFSSSEVAGACEHGGAR